MPRQAKAREAAAGTRPAGVAEGERARHVRRMFDTIAPTYDRANHLLSLGVDHYWRWRTVRALRRGLRRRAPAGEVRVLDVCCGTGDLSVALARGLGGEARIVGADFAFAMLERARAKAAAAAWIQADALRLPFAGESFAAVTSAFGFRNLSDYRAGLAEFRRLLQPGGLLAILEITEPTLPVLGALYRIYFERLLPRLGGWISGHAEAYRYLPDSVSRFPAPSLLAAWMRELGYDDPRCVRYGGGIATLHLARKAAVGAD